MTGCRIHLLLIALFLATPMAKAQAQTNGYLRSLKEYREKLLRNATEGDSAREKRCREKTAEYLALKTRYLQKLDSLDQLIREKNNTGSSRFYFLIISKPLHYQWGDCETRIIRKEGHIVYSIGYGGGHHCGENIIDSRLEIGIEDKFRVNSGFSSGQTYYREDLK